MTGLRLEVFTEDDILEMAPIMKRAFDKDTYIHLGEKEGGPTGYEDGSLLRKLGLHKDSIGLKIMLDHKMIGGAIIWIKENQENLLDILFIDDAYENKGIGVKVWQLIEARYPNTKKWYLDTTSYSRRNHYFYVNKCGFHIVKINNPKDWKEGWYTLEKVMK